MSEQLSQRDPHVLALENQIARLKAGKAIILGGESDVQYLTEEIEQLKAEDPSLASELEILVAELQTVDPSLSTFEARKNRSTHMGGGWNGLDQSSLKVLGILEAASKQPLKITTTEAQVLVDEKGLVDGIYTFRNTTGEVYVVVEKGQVRSGQIFEPPTYDIGYLMKGSVGIKFEGVIKL